jgi:hypothetical protein
VQDAGGVSSTYQIHLPVIIADVRGLERWYEIINKERGTYARGFKNEHLFIWSNLE